MTTLTCSTYTNNLNQRIKQRLHQSAGSLLIFGLLIYFWSGSAALRLHHPDEARYSAISLEMWRTHHWLIPQLLGTPFLDKPPLFYYCQMIAMWLLGPSPAVLRLPSMLGSILSCWVVYRIIRQQFDTPTGVFAALLLASFPLQFAMSHYANLDMLIAAGITLSLGAFYMAQSCQHTNRWLALMYISMGLAVLTKGLIAIVIPCLVIGVHYFWQRRRYYGAGIGLICLTAVTLPWFLWMDRHVPGFTYYYFAVQHFFRYLSDHYNNHQPGWFYIALLLVGTLPWTLLWLGNIGCILRHKSQSFFALGSLVPLIFFSIPTSKPIGYILPCLPHLAILITFAIKQTNGPHRHPLFWASLASLSLMIGIGSMIWAMIYHHHYGMLPATTLSIAGLIGLWQHIKFIPIQRRVWSTVLSVMAINLSILISVPAIPQYSSRHIANYLATQPEVPVAFYYDVFFDLLYYAPKQPILMVDDWQTGIKLGDTLVEQFALGLSLHNDTRFIDYQTFHQRWQQSQTKMFMITNSFYGKQFQKMGYCLLMTHGSRWLFSNQHCRIPHSSNHV